MRSMKTLNDEVNEQIVSEVKNKIYEQIEWDVFVKAYKKLLVVIEFRIEPQIWLHIRDDIIVLESEEV